MNEKGCFKYLESLATLDAIFKISNAANSSFLLTQIPIVKNYCEFKSSNTQGPPKDTSIIEHN